MATFIRRNIIRKQFTFEQLQFVKYFKRTDTKTYLVTDTTCLLQRLAFHPKEPTLHLMTSCRLLQSFRKRKKWRIIHEVLYSTFGPRLHQFAESRLDCVTRPFKQHCISSFITIVCIYVDLMTEKFSNDCPK